jgi:catechol 2,3-dioxygenase-like lactoylglutathione lyase family enzyme
MIGYVTIGSNDLPRARAFYDALLAELGGKQIADMGRLVMWGAQPGKPMIAVCTPYDGKPATVGNGMMVALDAGSKGMVDKLHAKALALGGKDEGAPGPRGGGYAGYFRDLDGNKLVAFVMA